jgi:hypothetical protein
MRKSMANVSQVPNGEVKIKRLLRRQSTQKFFKDDAGWTDNPAEARCFLDLIEVAETCARCGLDDDVEVILRISSQASDFFCTTLR